MTIRSFVSTAPGRLGRWTFPLRLDSLMRSFGETRRLNVVHSAAELMQGQPLYLMGVGNPRRLAPLKHPMSDGHWYTFTGLDKEAWQTTVDGGGFLLLDMMIEFLDATTPVVEAMYAGFADAGVDPARVAYLNQNLHSDAQLQQTLGNLGFDRRMKALPFSGGPWMLVGHNRVAAATSAAVQARLHTARRTLAGTQRDKAFICFNGRHRPHRMYLVLWLTAMGAMDRGLLSYLAYDVRHGEHRHAQTMEIERLTKRYVGEGYPFLESILPMIPEVMESLPLAIDMSRDQSLEGKAYADTLPWLSQDPASYDRAYFSIVTDTRSDDHGKFVTEKPYKSFMNLSPFVYIGQCGALEIMREHGFKTFSPFIDESYDLEPNHTVRLEKALVEIAKLVALTSAQLHDWYCEIWPILEHNYWNFYRDMPERFVPAVQAGIFGPLGYDITST